MQRSSFIFFFAATLLFACGQDLSAQTAAGAPAASADCTAVVPPVIAGSNPAERFARIYIGAGGSRRFGSGESADLPLDGSTAEKFDAILRRYSGNPVGDPAARPPVASVPPVNHLIVCLGLGVFQTEGSYDFVINLPHASNRGFAVGPYWHIHGAGIDKTTVRLISVYSAVSGSPVNRWVHAGQGVVFATVSDSSPGIEISDFTIDANYPTLKPRAAQLGIPSVNLEAIHLRSDQGGHFIHHMKVINAAGETSEAFPIWVLSVNNPVPPAPPKNTGNTVEYVTMSNFGKGKCTAIALANAAGEVRFNRVESYFIAYGGWNLSRGARFHDNVAVNTVYGFNVDSLSNTGFMIDHNQIVHPAKYGIVVGEAGTFTNFELLDNRIFLDSSRSIGILFQGHASQGVIARNSITAEGTPDGVKAFASKGPDNTGNNFQYNKISDSFSVDQSLRKSGCAFSNQNPAGAPHRNLPDTQVRPCVPGR
ncbi:MAG: hypothetical protein LAP21_18185 [Acidobacteriia bacterium]|nr:hypothetical protein [Terriglobia bacterium]